MRGWPDSGKSSRAGARCPGCPSSAIGCFCAGAAGSGPPRIRGSTATCRCRGKNARPRGRFSRRRAAAQPAVSRDERDRIDGRQQGRKRPGAQSWIGALTGGARNVCAPPERRRLHQGERGRLTVQAAENANPPSSRLAVPARRLYFYLDRRRDSVYGIPFRVAQSGPVDVRDVRVDLDLGPVV